MTRRLPLAAVLAAGTALAGNAVFAGELLPPASQRYESAASAETPDFQRHLMPLLGRLGCNGRACHGSFQGRGGFRLSLFGYDFDNDYQALCGGENPRVCVETPAASKILEKATLAIPHKGGKRMEEGGWEYNLLQAWIQAGAKPTKDLARLARLEVLPSEILCREVGQSISLQVLAYWEDGRIEDVTCLCRFRTNDDSVADVSETGVVECKGKGDAPIVAFYDNGVAVSRVILPVSDRVGPNDPEVAAPTPIDELVLKKLRKLGIVPSDLSSDAEFLRRASLDITGTLPSPSEIEAFLADSSPDKRSRKIDDLLGRPTYAAWWATKLCDITGNTPRSLVQPLEVEQTRAWYDWIRRRVDENVAYDKLVEGIVCASSRRPGQSYDEFAREMSSYFRSKDPVDFADREDMPLYWSRRDLAKPADKAKSFSYAFLGVRLECAECHKHPFDQWSQQDFNQFTAFFTRIGAGAAPESRKAISALSQSLGIGKLRGNELREFQRKTILAGKAYPWREVYVSNATTPAQVSKNGKKTKPGASPDQPRVLGGAAPARADAEDPRRELMDWLRSPENDYFARAFVNRVWFHYFGVGIIDPPDDQNLANPPSNPELLDYLTKGFIEHGYDMKWLHREITGSRTYQLSWRPNPTNAGDTRNFSRAQFRRLPAEAAYDAILVATSQQEKFALASLDLSRRTIASDIGTRAGGAFALKVFGKPDRRTNCDCERSMEPNLVQSIYLQNDAELLSLLDRRNGWIASVDPNGLRAIARAAQAASTSKAAPAEAKPLTVAAARSASPTKPAAPAQKPAAKPAPAKTKAAPPKKLKSVPPADDAKQPLTPAEAKELERRIAKLKSKGKAELASELEQRLLARARGKLSTEAPSTGAKEPTAAEKERWPSLVREAFLRTVSRPPTDQELEIGLARFSSSQSTAEGLRDLMWALLNTKEFIVNH